ncbi:hypothetical protein [Roseateles cavernae]|uniref:hypothetical protein n=1 Tax=Roseateles cavernae TaxID=3153578 RepID=UPI0032E47B11
MPSNLDETKILAFAVYELRLLLAGHLGSNATADPALRAAAHLAYALHNQALAILEGRTFSTAEAAAAIASVDRLCGESFSQRLSAVAEGPVQPFTAADGSAAR